MSDIERVWEAMDSLPDWNGRRNDLQGLSSYWAKRARTAEEALREIDALGGPLYLLSPNQGEHPDPVAAGEKLREIMDRYNA